MKTTPWIVAAAAVIALPAMAMAASLQDRYYSHDAVYDPYGVIAPWYQGINGPCDLRVRIAAETLKRFPWTTAANAIAPYPHYVFTGKWQIKTDGEIAGLDPGDWANGDLGQRATELFNGFVDYYRYTGDSAAIAAITYMADYILDHALTPASHPWPRMFISVPTKGKAYYDANPQGMIQLDICGSTGRGLLRAYQLTGNARWLEAAKRWGDVFAEKCNLDPGASPWPRYADPDVVKWPEDAARSRNLQTGSIVMILDFLDELIRLGYTGRHHAIVAARDAGRARLRDTLLPAWWVNDTWGRDYWDWIQPVQGTMCVDAAQYLMNHKSAFPHWDTYSRNMLTLFLNRTSVNPRSRSDVYGGAWAIPESCGCCGRSLWYTPLIHAPGLAQLGEETGDAWLTELAYREMVLQTYDIRETGVSEDSIDGGVIVNSIWLNIATALPLRHVLNSIGWLPERLGASRENHIVRSTAVVNSVTYGAGRIEYTTFDAPAGTTEVLRLAFAPTSVMADGKKLERRETGEAGGYAFKELPNGDAIVTIRHAGTAKIVVTGDDPQQVVGSGQLTYEGGWKEAASVRAVETAGASANLAFAGNQLRVIGRMDPAGGLADVYLDGVKQLVAIDYWNPSPRAHQVVYYKNGLTPGRHTLKVVARGEHNPYSVGSKVTVEAVQFSSAGVASNYPAGAGPTETQRMIFGYTGDLDYRDAQGQSWRPATELVTRSGAGTDSVMAAWWRIPSTGGIAGTPDPELYHYGVHGREFWVNLTVGPGSYHVRLKFAANRGSGTLASCFDVRINGQSVVERLDVAATAVGANRAVDLVFNHVAPRNGIIEVRFTGASRPGGDQLGSGEAFVQALEVGLGDEPPGATPVSTPLSQSARPLGFPADSLN